MKSIQSLAIFCGSSFGKNPCYRESAEEVARVLVENNIALVYGGATVGLMGVIAETVMLHGGKVIGVIPKSLADIEIANNCITQLHIVESMHERKALMAELSDGFIMLPGGIGSLEEFFEIFTWAQLGLHQKPCGILNINNYYASILNFLDHSVSEGFLKEANLQMIFVDTLIENLLNQFFSFEARSITKWIIQDNEVIPV
jgi:uncharacterized protein (TIGR00730 family)